VPTQHRVVSRPPRRGAGLALALLCVAIISPANAQTITVCNTLAAVVGEGVLSIAAVDTVVRDHRFGRMAPGCLLRLTGRMSAFHDASPPDEILRQVLPDQGWQEDLRYAADGPDGTAFALRRDGVLCMISAAWDGGDDSDPVHVPEERYELTIACYGIADPVIGP